jgi:hypothetical protein
VEGEWSVGGGSLPHGAGVEIEVEEEGGQPHHAEEHEGTRGAARAVAPRHAPPSLWLLPQIILGGEGVGRRGIHRLHRAGGAARAAGAAGAAGGAGAGGNRGAARLGGGCAREAGEGNLGAGGHRRRDQLHRDG